MMTSVTSTIDAERRRAWQDYAERLEGLEGRAYERAEQDAWDDLQDALHGLEDESFTADLRLG